LPGRKLIFWDPMKKNNAYRSIIFYVVLILFIVLPRLFLFFAENHQSRRALWPDESNYYRIAINLVDNHIFSQSTESPFLPTGYRGPVYPFFLAGIFFVLKSTHLSVLSCIQVIILAFLYVILANVYRQLNPEHPRRRIIFLLLVSLFPAFIVYPLRIISDFFFTFLIILYAWIQLRAFKQKNSLWHYIAGFSIGFASLCKPASFLLPVWIIPLVLWNSKKSWAIPVLCYILGISSALLPWIIRNKVVLNTYMPVLQGGRNLYASTMNRLSEIPIQAGKKLSLYGGDFLNKESQDMTEAEADAKFLKNGFALIIQHPFVYLKFCFIKGYNLWKIPIGYTLVKQRSRILAGIFLCGYICFLIIALYGIFMLARKMTPVSVLPAVIIVYFTVFHSLTHSLPRYHLPCLPFLFIGAVFAIQKIASNH